MQHDDASHPEIQAQFSRAIQQLTTDDWRDIADISQRLNAYDGPYFRNLGSNSENPRVITMPFYEEDPIVIELRELLYGKKLILPFAWSRWVEGRALASSNRPDRYATISPETAVMVLTSVVRNDRFCENAFVLFVKSGDAALLLERLLTARPNQA